MDRKRQQTDQQRCKPEPEQENAGCKQLQRHQQNAEDQPVPGAQRRKHLAHGVISKLSGSSMSMTKRHCAPSPLGERGTNSHAEMLIIKQTLPLRRPPPPPPSRSLPPHAP